MFISEHSERGRNGKRAKNHYWWGCWNTFSPVITVLYDKRIKRQEDPPWWHLESLHPTALIQQTVGGLNVASLKSRRMCKMSKIIEALCKGEHMLKFYQAGYLDKIWRRQPGILYTQLLDQRKFCSCSCCLFTQRLLCKYNPLQTRHLYTRTYVSQVLFRRDETRQDTENEAKWSSNGTEIWQCGHQFFYLLEVPEFSLAKKWSQHNPIRHGLWFSVSALTLMPQPVAVCRRFSLGRTGLQDSPSWCYRRAPVKDKQFPGEGSAVSSPARGGERLHNSRFSC